MTEQRMAKVFVELADTLIDEFDIVDFLTMLTDRCVEVLHVESSGLMLTDEAGRLQLLAGTSQSSRELELFELQVDQGPCVDAFTTGQALTNVRLTSALDRWPVFAPAAVEAGVIRTSALPMRLRGRVIGALNLFDVHDRELSPEALEIGQAMADIATIGLINERSLREKTVLSEQLQSALQSRILVEQAKGVLAARARTGVEDAFNRMRRYARGHGLQLTVVAAAVVEERLVLDVEGQPVRD